MTERDEPYTNLDLDTADEILVAAGQPAIAKALRYQTQGNRNLIQGEWGMQVVSSFEKILNVQVVTALANVQQTLDQQHALVQQILASQKNSEKVARQALTVAKAGAARLGKLESRMDASEDDRADLRARLNRIEALLDARPAARVVERQELLAALRGDTGDGTQ